MIPRTVLATITLLLAVLIVGCSGPSAADEAEARAVAERVAGVTACNDYKDVQRDLIDAYEHLGETKTADAAAVHIREIERVANVMAQLAHEVEDDGHEQLSKDIAAMAEIVEQSAADARIGSQIGNGDALRKTSAEMIYVEKPILETCGMR